MNIRELLQMRGLDPKAKVKMVRHQDSRCDVEELMNTGLIEFYQSCQTKLIYNCDYVASFIGMSRHRARFIGLYRVKGHKKVSDVEIPDGYPLEEDPDYLFYLLEKVPGFEDLEERVVIDWGPGAINWHQWLDARHKEVVEILPVGYARPFPGYLDFILSYHELKRIVDHPQSNHEWHVALCAVGGIYLILNRRDGSQYVGSATGARGILGRWEEYAKSLHGGNTLLRKACRVHPTAHHDFRYSVLCTLNKSLAKSEVIRQENLFKEKLGSRTFGLNSN